MKIRLQVVAARVTSKFLSFSICNVSMILLTTRATFPHILQAFQKPFQRIPKVLQLINILTQKKSRHQRQLYTQQAKILKTMFAYIHIKYIKRILGANGKMLSALVLTFSEHCSAQNAHITHTHTMHVRISVYMLRIFTLLSTAALGSLVVAAATVLLSSHLQVE